MPDTDSTESIAAMVRHDMAAWSSAHFALHRCGMRVAEHHVRWLSLMDDAWDEAQASKESDAPFTSKLLVLGPRDHSKTTTAIAFATKAICDNRKVRVLYVSPDTFESEKHVARINELQAMAFPVQADYRTAPDGGPVDPAVSLDAGWVGMEVEDDAYDLIILDDPQSHDSVLTPDQRDKGRAWLMSLKPALGGMLLMLATRKHIDDMYDAAIHDPTWFVSADSAIVKWPAKSTPIYMTEGRNRVMDWTIEGDYEVLWPEERPLKKLLTIRKLLGRAIFDREMQNHITSIV